MRPNARPIITFTVIELDMACFTLSGRFAPKYWAITVVVAIVIPVINANNAKVIGELTETAANASAPRNFPTHIVSTVL